MRKIRASLVRLRHFFDQQGRDADVAAELESHVQFHIEDNLRVGMSPEEARRQALIKLGGLNQTKESVRAQRGFLWLDSRLQDTHFAIRMLRKNPAFTAVVVLTLAVAIGANATVFIIADTVLFKNLPFANSERVLYVSSVNRETGYGRGVSYPDYRYLASRTTSLQGLAAFSGDDTDVSDNGVVPTQVRGTLFTANAFSVIGQQPLMGRESVQTRDTSADACRASECAH